MEPSRDIPVAAPHTTIKHDPQGEHQPVTRNQPPRLESTTNSDGRIILRMAGSKNSSTPMNQSEPPPESTEKSENSKDAKPRKKRNRKPVAISDPPRRSGRHTSAKAEETKAHSMESPSQAPEASKSKSCASTTKSTSPPPASNASTAGIKKRGADEMSQVGSVPSIVQEDSQGSFPKSSDIPMASKRRKLLPQRQQQRSTVSPSITTDQVFKDNFPLTSSEKSGSLTDTPNPCDDPPNTMNSLFNNIEFPITQHLCKDSLEESPVPASNSPSALASPATPRGVKRKASELATDDVASVPQTVDEVLNLEVRGSDNLPSKAAKTFPSASPSPAIPEGTAKTSMDGVSNRESPAIVPSESASLIQQNTPRKRGRPAAGSSKSKKVARKALSKPTLKKSAPSGRRKKTSENAKTQAMYDRQMVLKKNYREIAKGYKAALAMIADRDLDLMAEDPTAHQKQPEFKIVNDGLDARYCARVAKLEQAYETQLQFAETQYRQEVEYSEIQFRCAIQDIVDRSLARAEEAFVTTYDAGVRQEIVEDDNLSVDGNRDVHLRDLNAFNAHDDEHASATIETEQPKTDTPLKSQSENRDPKTSSLLDVPRTAPTAKHSLLAVPQEREPSSLPPSRVCTPEALDNGKFDEYGVHIPTRVRRGRMIEPNNRAIVKSWIEYDTWDIQHEIASKKRARNQSGEKKTDLIYLDQTSFTNQGGGGYKLSDHRPEDFDQDMIKRYGLHPTYGIPVKGSKNHVDPSEFTDFSKSLDNTKPIVIVDVEETRPVSSGGTRKPAELREPFILSRSTPMIDADRNYENFLIRDRMRRALERLGAGEPNVEGFATYDAAARDEQKAQEAIAELLEASRIVNEASEKAASAAAAAAAANIAQKSSIHAIVSSIHAILNSDDGDTMSPNSRVNKRHQKPIKTKAPQPVSVPGFDALNEAIDLKTAQDALQLRPGTPHLPPGSFFYGPRPRDYGPHPREYMPSDVFAERNMPPPTPQPYIQQQVSMHPQLPPPQSSMPYNSPAHARPQQQQVPPQAVAYSSGAPAQPPHQMMLPPHPISLTPIFPYYTPAPQNQVAAPATHGYPPFNHFVSSPPRPSDQTPGSSRSHRELRPMPPQNSMEWVPKHEPAHFYHNSPPRPASHGPPAGPTTPYPSPHSFAFWAQQNQVPAQPAIGLPQLSPQAHAQAPAHHGSPMQHGPPLQAPLLPNPFTSGPADVPHSSGPAVNHHPREDEAQPKKATQSRSRRGRKR